MMESRVDGKEEKMFNILMKIVQVKNSENLLGEHVQVKAKGEAEFSREVTQGCLEVISLSNRDFMEKMN